uniref:Helitron_like_N domain-containing protein n=1 Tax=Meloidogyne hapla TaxID=6305 RepID=A0A1I8BYJ3_MELHA
MGNQKTICADAYRNVDSYLAKRSQETGKPLGRKVILPPTVTNSPRYVEKHIQDAMSLVRKFGKPDLFVTMTCNSQWDEILENLYKGQVPSDRPDLVDRVFFLKVKALLNEITKVKIFGRDLCWMYPIENQVISAEDVDKRGISARIPDIDKDIKLYDLVKKVYDSWTMWRFEPKLPVQGRETINSVSSVKYLHKYVHKLPDRASMNYEEKNDYDEKIYRRTKFVFRKGKWNERKTHFNTIGRMVKISPAETERYHLRLLLLNVRGAISYEDLRAVKNIDLDNIIRCATFAEACLARGLIRDDEEWKKALEEANSLEMP